jgi:hypothetical protein
VVELNNNGSGIQFPGITVGDGGGGTTPVETAAIKFVPTSDYAGSGTSWQPGNVILHPIISTTTAYFDPTRQASGNSGIPALAGTALPNGVTVGAKVEVNLTGSGFASSGGISKNNLPIGRYLVKVDWAYSSHPSYPTGYNTSTWFLLDLPYKLGTTTTPAMSALGTSGNPLILYVNPESIRYSGSSGSGDGGAMVRFIRTDDTMPPYIDFIQAFSTDQIGLDTGNATAAQLLEGNSKIPVNLPESPPSPVVNASVGPFYPGRRHDISFPQGEAYLLRYSISTGGGMGEDQGYKEVYAYSYTYNLFYLDIDRWEQRGYGSADNPILIYISADGGMEFSPEMTEDTYVTVGVLPVPNNPSTIPYGLHLFRVEYPGQVFGVIETGEAGETFSSITSLGNPGFHTSPSMVSYTGPSGDNYNLFKIPSGQYFVQTESVKDGAHYYAGYSQTQWFYLDTETIRSLAEFGHPGTRNNPINILLTRNANGTTCIKMQYQGLIIHP